MLRARARGHRDLVTVVGHAAIISTGEWITASEAAVERILELVKTRIPKRFGLNSIRDVQVLCPMNRGGVGARSLNIELQAALNPAGERKVERFGWTFAPGDKVMQIENDYDKEVYNGDRYCRRQWRRSAHPAR